MRSRSACLLAALLALAGCGGGLWVSWGFDDCDGCACGCTDTHPSVSLRPSTPTARSGETVQLVAAASDDFGVERVSFFRIEANGGDTLLGVDDIAPYQIDIVIAGAGTVQFFARAFDDSEQSGDSAPVSVSVLP